MKHARTDYDHIQDPSGKIPDNEPVFLLRGQDPLAAAAVAHYAGLLAVNNLPRHHVEAVLQHAADMAAWPIQKLPDCPTPTDSKAT